MRVIVYKKNKVIKRLIADRSKWRKVYAKLASAGSDKWFVEVNYGYDRDAYGQKVMFKNTGTYNNLKEAKAAFKAFIER